jgi:hypothetical protein
MNIDHDTTDVSGLIERYLRGELSADEEKAWEEHYFQCIECFNALEETAGIAQFIRVEAPNRPDWYEGTQPRLSLVRSLTSAFKQAPPWQSLLAAAMVLVVVGLPALLGWMKVTSLEREWSVLQRPSVLGRSYVLQEGQRDETPAVSIPQDAGQFLLQFNLLAADEEPTSHSAQIDDSKGQVIWTANNLAGLGPYGTFAVSCHSSFFAPGTYHLRVNEIRAADGAVVNSFLFPFRVSTASGSEE